VGCRHGELRATNAFPLDNVLGFAQTRCVIKTDGKAGKVQINMKDIPSRPRNIRHNSNVPACQVIKKARFSGIRRASDHDMQAVTQNFPCSSARKMVNDFLFQGAHVIPYGTGNGPWNVIFIGEIKLCLDHSAAVRQSFRPRIVKPR